jgi:hypothetical protein
MKYLLSLFMFISVAAFSQSDSTIISVDSAVVETDSVIIKKPKVVELKQYRITVPEGWRVQTGCIDEKCVLLSPRDTLGTYDRFTENISITINKLSSSKYTADMYANFSKGYLPKVVSNFEVLERKRLKYNKVLMIYQGKKDKYEQTWMQYYIVKHSRVYIVTCSLETKNYEYYRPIIEEYATTFALK